MGLIPCEIDILFDASEDYTALWDAKWECGIPGEDVPENQLIGQGQDAVIRLAALGLISLFRRSTSPDFIEVAPGEVNALVRQTEYWQLPAHEHTESVYLAATDEGKRVLRQDEQVRDYYRGNEFLARYPDPEWHPMKRS